MTDPPRPRGTAQTAPASRDPRLRGRTYAVPFEAVWQAALRLTDDGLPGWSRLHADDHAGVIRATVRSRTNARHDVEIRIGLDPDAQTRVDAHATPHVPGRDFGRAARRLHSFCCALDRALAPTARRKTVHRT